MAGETRRVTRKGRQGNPLDVVAGCEVNNGARGEGTYTEALALRVQQAHKPTDAE
jgi:hypothetical protein